MKKLAIMACVVSIPLMLGLSAAQSARYYAVTVELKKLESAQSEWIEENRRLLANIAVAKSRARVDAAMEKAEGYRMVSPKTTLRIRVKPEVGKRDGS